MYLVQIPLWAGIFLIVYFLLALCSCKRRLRTSRCPCRGRLGTLKTPSCPWHWCPAAGQNLETRHLSRHYIAEISLNVTLNHSQQQQHQQLCVPCSSSKPMQTRHPSQGPHYCHFVSCHWSVKYRSRTQTTTWHQWIMSRWTVGASLVNVHVAQIGTVI